MNELYVKSEDIAIVPVAKKREGNAGLLTEKNFTAVIKALSFSEDYVCSVATQGIGENSTVTVKFVIGGYYIDATIPGKWLIEQGVTSKSPLYAIIQMDSNDEISGQDDGGVYKGVKFSFKDEQAIDGTVRCLKLFNWSSEDRGEISIIPESMQSVLAKHLIIGGIDGKH